MYVSFSPPMVGGRCFLFRCHPYLHSPFLPPPFFSQTFLFNYPFILKRPPSSLPFPNFLKKDGQAISKLFYTSTYLMGGLTLLPYTQNTVHIGFWRLLWHLNWEPEENKSLVPKTFPFLLPLTLYPFSLRYTEWKFVGRSPPLPATAVGLQRLAAQPNNSKLFICSHVLFLKEKNEYVHFAKFCFLQQKHLPKTTALLHRNLGYFPMVVGIAVELSLARSLGIPREMYESREGRKLDWEIWRKRKRRERKCTPEMQFEKTSFFDNFRTKVSRILRVNYTGAGVKRGFLVGLNMDRFSICSNNNMVLRPDPRVLLLHCPFLSCRFLNIGSWDDRPTQPN